MGYDTRTDNDNQDVPKKSLVKHEIIEEEVMEEEVCDDTVEKPALSELENIIMEEDIILNVHADAENEEVNRGWQIERRPGIGEYCTQHKDLFHLCDDKLVQPGDTFSSHKEFIEYISTYAKRWHFYYKCTESYNVDTENESYVYNCVYLKNKDYKRKSVKKRYNSKTDCPCKIKLKRKPNEKLTVMYVCNHHDHELSETNFNKLVNSKKLPPYIKEVIMDLISLEVEVSKISKFVEMETGIKMNRTFFYEIERKMKLYNEDRQIPEQRLRELSEKIAVMEDMDVGDDEGNNTEEQTVAKKRPKGPKSAQAKKKKTDYLEITIPNINETQESVNNLRDTMNDSQEDWIIDETQDNDRNDSADWEISSIQNNEESQARGDTDDSHDYTQTTENYTTELEVTEATQNQTELTEHTENQGEIEYQTVVLQDEFGNVINCGNGEQIVIIQGENGLAQTAEGETIGYFDGEKIIYMDEGNIQNIAAPKANDSAETNLKQRESDVKLTKLSDLPDETIEFPATNGKQEIVTGDIYTKHEYIHRYNIDHYMTKPSFPKYIETLAKKTRVDVLHMLTKVYNEKAMFKMTTTQRGNEGNTKIWYLTDVRRKGQYKLSDEEKRKRDKIGQYLTDILILKETVKSLRKQNEELVSRNKYLEDVALRLANMRNN